MIIMGIDPGFSCTGYSILRKEGTRVHLVDHGFLKMSPTKHLSERIGIFHTFFTKKIEDYHVTAIALETPFLGKNAQNFLKLGYLRGILYLLSNTHTLILYEFSPREIKLSVTGYGAAQKEQVACVVMRFFPGLSAPAKADVTDAIAIGLCGVWQSRNNVMNKFM